MCSRPVGRMDHERASTYRRSVKVAGSFFFSSRRRHTRYIGDWSSDVCSSDLATMYGELLPTNIVAFYSFAYRAAHGFKIGRASCRERVKLSTLDGTLE